MISFILPGKSFFSPKTPKTPKLPPAPAPIPVTRADDPSIAAAAKKQRDADLRRKGRGATLVAGNLSPLGAAQVRRPGAQVLG